MATKKVAKMTCYDRLEAEAKALSLKAGTETVVEGRRFRGQGRKVVVFEHLPQTERVKYAPKVVAITKGGRSVACSDGSYTVHHTKEGEKGAKVLRKVGLHTGQSGPRVVDTLVQAAKTKGATKVPSVALPKVSMAKKEAAAKATSKTKATPKAKAKATPRKKATPKATPTTAE